MINLKNNWIETKKKEIFEYKSVIELLDEISINEISYSQLLKCLEWQYKRFKILVRDGFTCRDCGEISDSLHVHHIYYLKDKLPWEIDDLALLSLCKRCHVKRHENDNIYTYKELGSKLVLAKNHFYNCPRCNGSGFLSQFKHVEDGICFLCFGNFIPKTIFIKRLKEISINSQTYVKLNEECLDFLDSISLDFFESKIHEKFNNNKLKDIDIEEENNKVEKLTLVPCYITVDNEKKYGYMYSDTKKVAVKCQFEKTYPFHGYIAKVLYKGNIIYVTRNGFFIQPNESFYGSLSFKNGLVPAYASRELNPLSTEKIFGYVDIQSDDIIKIPFEYNQVRDFIRGFAAVKKGVKWGVIDSKGNVVIPFIYELLIGTENLLFITKKIDKWGVINIENEEVIPLIYDSYSYCRKETIHTLSKEGKFGFYDTISNKFFGLNYQGACCFNEEYAAVKINGKWGYIDKSFNTVIPFDFDDAKSFHDGIAAVKKGKEWGYISKNGDIILSFKFRYVTDFYRGIAQVEFPLSLKQKIQLFINRKYERVLHKIDIKGESTSSFKEIVESKNLP